MHICPNCGYPHLMGTGMLSLGGKPERLVCLRCGVLGQYPVQSAIKKVAED